MRVSNRKELLWGNSIKAKFSHTQLHWGDLKLSPAGPFNVLLPTKWTLCFSYRSDLLLACRAFLVLYMIRKYLSQYFLYFPSFFLCVKVVLAWVTQMHLAGFVAFYVEDNLQQPAYGLYSPDGGCQHQLGRIQVDPNLSFSSMTMMLLDKKILACGQAHATDCYLYDVGSDTWTVTTGPGALYTTQGVVLHQKMYLPDEYSPKVFDSATKKWSNWAKGGTDTYVSCYVAWEDYIFKFGGYPPHDERYDPADDTWSFVTTSPPFPIYLSGCVVLANDNILITGSGMEEWFIELTLNTMLPAAFGHQWFMDKLTTNTQQQFSLEAESSFSQGFTPAPSRSTIIQTEVYPLVPQDLPWSQMDILQL